MELETWTTSLLEIEEVGYCGRQMGHQLHSDPPVWLHGVVSCVRALGRDSICDVIQDRGHFLLSTIAVWAHQRHMLLKVGFPVILLHIWGRLIPQLVRRGGHNVTGQDAGGHNEVPWFDYGHFYSPGLHLVAKAVSKSFHTIFRYTVRWSHDVSHPPVHTGQVHHTTCKDIRISYFSATNSSISLFQTHTVCLLYMMTVGDSFMKQYQLLNKLKGRSFKLEVSRSVVQLYLDTFWTRSWPGAVLGLANNWTTTLSSWVTHWQLINGSLPQGILVFQLANDKFSQGFLHLHILKHWITISVCFLQHF